MNRQAIAAFLILTLASTLTATQLASAASTDDWPMFHHDLAHTDYSTSTGPTSNQTLWVFPTGGAIETSPAVVDGKVYFGSDDGSVYCVNASNGAMIWNYSTGGPVQSSPDVLDGIVFIGGFHSHAVFSLNASSGVLLWRTPIASEYPDEISSTAVADGLVFVDVGNANDPAGNLYALNATTGTLAWTYRPSAWLWSSPAYSNGLVYIEESTYQVKALYALSGQIAWTYYLVGPVGSNSSGGSAYSLDGSLQIGDGIAYIGGIQAEMVQALNASTGEFIWVSYTSGNPNDIAVAGNIVFVSTTYGGTSSEMHTGGVSALDARTGKLLWNHTIGSMSSSPTVANGIVYATSNSNKPVFSEQANETRALYAFNATTGGTIWSYDSGNALFSSPAVANGTLYVASNDGKVYAFGTAQSNLPTPPSSPTPPPTPAESTTTSQTPSPSIPEFQTWIIPLLALVGPISATILRKRTKKA